MTSPEAAAPWWRARSLAERAAGEDQPAGARAPDWWQWLVGAFADGTVADSETAQLDGRLLRGCLRLVRPLRLQAERELARRAEIVAGAGPAPFEAPAAARLLARTIAVELAELSAPAVALELHAAAAAGELHGATSEERAARFMADFGRPARRRELIADYPALARLLHDRARLGVEAGAELLERLSRDRERLAGDLLGHDTGALISARPLGDSHNGGRRVLALEFDSGARVVYKPRSLAADAAYAAVLDWLARAGLTPAPRAPRSLLAGNDHGWQEQVTPAACSTRAEVARYFRRLGAQLAVLHALRGIDFHHENVIACGEHPLMVDLEGLFHPRLGGERAEAVDPLVAETGLDCVLRVGLLPRADVAFGVDISGLGRDPRSQPVVEETGWVDSGTDSVRLAAREQPVQLRDNVVRLGPDAVTPHEWVDDLATGFRAAHRLLCRHADALLAPGGPVASFAGAETRAILRPTRAYVELLRRLVTEPSALGDGLAQERVLEALWRGRRRRPDLGRAAPAERYDLWHGEVPKITGSPGTSDGRHHALGELRGLFAPHGFESLDCLRRLDRRDEERQLAFIEASVRAAAPELPAPEPMPPPLGTPPAAGALLEAAHRCGRRLVTLALWDNDRAGWLSAQPAPGHAGRVLRAAGSGLANGDAGIAVFLARLAAVTGDAEALACADAAGRRVAAVVGGDHEPVDDDLGHLALALAARVGAGLPPHARGLAEAEAPARAGSGDGSLLTGAAGAALVLAALVAAGEAGLEHLCKECAEVALRDGLGYDHSLGTGDAGVLLAARASAAALADERLAREAARRTGGLLELVERDGLRFPGGVEQPSLLDGTAGIGLALLALGGR